VHYQTDAAIGGVYGRKQLPQSAGNILPLSALGAFGQFMR